MSVLEVEERDCCLSGTKRKVVLHPLYANTDLYCMSGFLKLYCLPIM